MKFCVNHCQFAWQHISKDLGNNLQKTHNIYIPLYKNAIRKFKVTKLQVLHFKKQLKNEAAKPQALLSGR